ncbi:T9SS type A sorting domain-containing protein [Xylanibacter brevis]|uniref:T9SS type A sorting domain-containing protein n=1 Tax=Xylanibacter brevis TaxID=83231 RepID=UPI00048832C9|nr:T9SS type A sorting domain-containing protein [Xylanibacter brevis]
MKKLLLSVMMMMVLGAASAVAQTVIPVKVDQYPPLKAVAETVTVDVSQGAITVGSDVSVEGGDGSYTYLWTNAAGQQVGNQKTYEINHWGNYYLKVTDGHGCQVSVMFTATDPAGIAATDIQDVQQIKLFDLKGRLVKNTRSITTYTDGLQNGTYVLCRIYADGTESVQKITVKK